MTEEQNNLDTGFKIVNLLMLECEFKRTPKVSFNHENIETIVEINVEAQVNENQVVVTELLVFQQTLNDVNEVSAIIKFIGVFESNGNTAITLEEFGHINGAAIIFPYIREQLSNLSLKAGIGNLILPPVNFVKKYEEKKRSSSSSSKL